MTSRQGPVLCLWPERILFIGHLGALSRHRHAATVCVVALDDVIRLRLPPSDAWHAYPSLLIPAGRAHAIDTQGALVAVLYNDPHQPYYERLSAHSSTVDTLEEGHCVALAEALRDVHAASPSQFASALTRFEQTAATVLRAGGQSPRIDRRVRSAIELIQRDLTQRWSLDELARATKLSPDRLRHLFADVAGVPLRRLRTWLRFRHALESFARGDLSR